MARHDDYEERFSDLALLAYQAAFRLTGNRQASEDVAQETMARAYQRWARVRGYSEAWVVRVATNQVIGTWRRKHSHGHLTEASGRATDDAVATRLALTSALKSLPRRQRQVAVLRYLGDLSIEATAEAMGCSISSVKAHSARALVALRRHEALSPEAPEPQPIHLHSPAVTAPGEGPEPAKRPAPLQERTCDVPRA